MEKSKMRLHLDVVPPPPPPRTVTLLKPIISSQSGKLFLRNITYYINVLFVNILNLFL